MIKKLIKQLRCKHDWNAHGWSYIKCKQCDRTKYNPAKNAEILNKRCSKMVSEGHWTEQEASKIRNTSLIYADRL